MAIVLMGEAVLGITVLSVAIWIGLLVVWGQFWRCDQRLEGERVGSGEMGGWGDDGQEDTETEEFTASPRLPLSASNSSPLTSHLSPPTSLPSVYAVIPARNEADLLPVTLRSLLTQDYSGLFQIVLVDDQSTDGTGNVAQQIAQNLDQTARLKVINAAPLPADWTGKLWAMEQGVRAACSATPAPDYFLFTDADIEHDRGNLRRLVSKAQQNDLDLVSLMVLLRCQSVWEKLLIPAFVFFFQKLYPFRLVNNPNSPIAAAAGGCILIRREALIAIGGLEILRQALIDDCTLAQAVKRQGRWGDGEVGRWGDEEVESVQNSKFKIQNSKFKILQPRTLHLAPRTSGRIWLGLTQTTRSLRPYPSLTTIWDMVARTAYTQLNYSPWLLVGTLVGMTLIYLVAPISAIAALMTQHWLIAGVGLIGWLLMAIAYLPTVRLYRLSPLWALCLPAIAALYTLMTIDSAIRHWQGRGGAWKGRVYPAS